MLCYVDTADTVVFAAFMQMHTDTQYTAYMPLIPPREKALLRPLSCGFRASPPSSLRMQHYFKMFWDFSHYKVNYRQDTQPIPNTYMLMGTQQPGNSYISMIKLHLPHYN